MVEQRQVLHSGGCQCGAVRYALYAEPYDTHICHCRMCQKAFGAYYAPLTKMRYTPCRPRNVRAVRSKRCSATSELLASH